MWAVFSAHCSAKTMPVVLICTAAIFIVGHRVPRIAVGVALGQTDAHHAQNTDSADQEGRKNITRLWTFLRFFSKSSRIFCCTTDLWSALTCGGARGLGRCSTSIGRVCQSDAGTSLWYDWCAATILLLDVVVTFWYILHILRSCARK